MCERCRRPRSVCFCADIVPIATQTRVLILQHPRERDVGINTARLARLGLAGAALRIDVDFREDPVVREVLAAGNAFVLFPGPEAIDVETASFPSPITLVVLDGTWWQAQKLLKANPALAALPRLRMTPEVPSVYGQIRREPADHCVATLEAIAHVLGHLEGDPARFAKLLCSLGEMVKRQLHFATEIADHRHRRSPVRRERRDAVPAILRERAADIVCVHGEANAWPRLHPGRTRPEIVHWLARRMASGDMFESVIVPRGRLAPSTCHHIGIFPEALAAGESWDVFTARLQAFLRPSDVVVVWGRTVRSICGPSPATFSGVAPAPSRNAPYRWSFRRRSRGAPVGAGCASPVCARWSRNCARGPPQATEYTSPSLGTCPARRLVPVGSPWQE